MLSETERKFLKTEALTVYDNDAGMTMLRIGSMNLMLYGIEPRFFLMDTLSKNDDKRQAVSENDIPDILECWKRRFDDDFNAQRERRKLEIEDDESMWITVVHEEDEIDEEALNERLIQRG